MWKGKPHLLVPFVPLRFPALVMENAITMPPFLPPFLRISIWTGKQYPKLYSKCVFAGSKTARCLYATNNARGPGTPMATNKHNSKNTYVVYGPAKGEARVSLGVHILTEQQLNQLG